MAQIFKHPELSDYFVEHRDMNAPVIEDYEAGKVIALPELMLDMDHEFWASMSVDAYPGLKKPLGADDGGVTLDRSLAEADVPDAVRVSLVEQANALLDQIRPHYMKLFAGYEFVKKKVAWRLTETLNENSHIDTYRKPALDHFARMFINLDVQPRIWRTGYTLEEMYALFGAEAMSRLGPEPTLDEVHAMVNRVAFGGATKHWWDNHPKHVIYFAPGDAWIADSRQVAHQIFYGRRALSVDFFVDVDSMRDRSRHYLAMAESFLRSVRSPSHSFA